MPRKQRIEYAGAVYHVISRGNYRKELFLKEQSGLSFEKTLFEAVERCNWRLHAYVIMGNHYHLALETPEPNLVDGMRWLQSTFATRFNRFRKESGHVFQGRYKALLVGDGQTLSGLVNYIHLNPVRAGICSIENLRGYDLSSYPKYFMKKIPPGLCRGKFLSMLGFPDSLSGMRRYAESLGSNRDLYSESMNEQAEQYIRGWFIGSKEDRHALEKELLRKNPDVEWEGTDLRELNEMKWENLVLDELKRQGKTETDLVDSPKGADWKTRIALKLRSETTASNPWISTRLNMGHPSRISNSIRKLKAREKV